MFDEHGFSVGLPTNLVHLPRLLEILKIKLDHLQCIYCEHVFKSGKVLKEHMRKKRHWRLNRNNSLYDRFYLVNYSSPGKKNVDSDDDDEQPSDVDEEEDDPNMPEWEANSDDDGNNALCVFCSFLAPSPKLCFDHMMQDHHFDFFRIKTDLGTSYRNRAGSILNRPVKTSHFAALSLSLSLTPSSLNYAMSRIITIPCYFIHQLGSPASANPPVLLLRANVFIGRRNAGTHGS